VSQLARRSASGIVPAALIGPMCLDGRGRDRAWTLLQVPLFLAALFLVRALPALLYRSQLGMRRTMAAGFLQATSLPFIVAAVRIGGTVLGVYPDPVLTQAVVRLAPGDALVLYTDGVTEARGSDGFYGEQRLDALLTGCGGGSAEHIAGSVAEEVLRVQQGSLHDDAAVLRAAFRFCEETRNRLYLVRGQPGEALPATGPVLTHLARSLGDVTVRTASPHAVEDPAAGANVDDFFFPVLGPGWLGHFVWNEHYKTEEEYVHALAAVFQSDYKAGVDAGFILQIDDPGLCDRFGMIDPPVSIEEYRRQVTLRIEATNWALEGIPEERVRYHTCWGSWHTPHTTDIPFEHVLDIMLQVKAGAYSVEAADVRHELDWKLWDGRFKLPEGKVLIPGDQIDAYRAARAEATGARASVRPSLA